MLAYVNQCEYLYLREFIECLIQGKITLWISWNVNIFIKFLELGKITQYCEIEILTNTKILFCHNEFLYLT